MVYPSGHHLSPATAHDIKRIVAGLWPVPACRRTRYRHCGSFGSRTVLFPDCRGSTVTGMNETNRPARLSKSSFQRLPVAGPHSFNMKTAHRFPFATAVVLVLFGVMYAPAQ